MGTKRRRRRVRRKGSLFWNRRRRVTKGTISIIIHLFATWP